MLYVALIEGVALIATALAFTSVLRWQIRQSARREDMLVNQICALAGRPWQEPPAWRGEPVAEEPELAFMAAPEQLPDY